MTEKLLQYIWRHRYFNHAGLRVFTGESLEIIHTGISNPDQGPDFLNALIRLDNTTWAGNIELHLRTSDWDRHAHQDDPHYKNIILHVVWENDLQSAFHHGLPVLELQDRIPKILLSQLEEWRKKKTFIPCGLPRNRISDIAWLGWKERLLAERIMQHAGYLEILHRSMNGNWEETCWRTVCRQFGASRNVEFFETVAGSLPLSLIGRHRQQPIVLEALLMGQAGLLNDVFTDDYPMLLKKEYEFYRKKYKLHPSGVKPFFLRMRPENFPTIRFSQLAMLLHANDTLFSRIHEADSLADLISLLDLKAGEYWDTHYIFDKPSGYKIKNTGSLMKDIIIINGIIPLLFAYGNWRNEPALKKRVIGWLYLMKAEKNKILSGFEELGVIATHAADSQALLQLKSHYCNPRRCLECTVGYELLKNIIPEKEHA